MTFPVSQSVLDADALADELIKRYGLKGDVRCRLLSRGMNDIYRIGHQAGPHALKVARAGKSTKTEFSYEQDYVQHLSGQGIEVSSPVALLDGSMFFSVTAPEGQRHIVMMRWLEGVPYAGDFPEDDAFRMGAFLGRMHLSASSFSSPHEKLVDSERKVRERLPYLLAMVEPQSDDHEFLARAAETVLEQLGSSDWKNIPRGPCHGDLQCANIMKLAFGGLGAFDFSDCGHDPLVKDIAAFNWRNDFDDRPQAVNQSFVDGYDSIRRLSDSERAVLPLFRVLRHIFITSTMAQYVNHIGPVVGFDRKLDFYFDMLRRYCREAGIV